MIRISEDILTAAELSEASGKKQGDIDIEFTNVAIEKSGSKSSLVVR